MTHGQEHCGIATIVKHKYARDLGAGILQLSGKMTSRGHSQAVSQSIVSPSLLAYSVSVSHVKLCVKAMGDQTERF